MINGILAASLGSRMQSGPFDGSSPSSPWSRQEPRNYSIKMNINCHVFSRCLVITCLALPMLAEKDKERNAASSPGAAQYESEQPQPKGAPETASRSHIVGRATESIGLEIQNLQGEKLGKVDDLAIDWGSGQIVEVVVSTGGVLGVGATVVGVPPAAFRYDHDAKVLRLDRTKDSLKELPPFDVSAWSENFQPARVEASHKAFGLSIPEPYRPVAADNTALNRRDLDSNTLTPVDQGSEPEDVAITSRIRKAVMETEGLSVNAQNVKIITLNGLVTLRGPVNSEEERRIVGEIAAAVVKPADVVNQLDVVSSATNR